MTEVFDPHTVPIRPAATIMLVRDCAEHPDIEVFMLRRTLNAVFGSGMFVFPGGRVDPGDHLEQMAQVCTGLTDQAASEVLGIPSGGLAFWVGALRECFEEAGVLMARSNQDGSVVRLDDVEMHRRCDQARHEIHAGTLDFADFCKENALSLMTDEVRYVSHWATPIGERRRFDTRFFLARAPEQQQPLHDDNETIASLWTRPTDALDLHQRQQLTMMPPTVASLQFLATFRTANDALRSSAIYGGDISPLAR